MAIQYWFDLCYSVDDGGWYGDVFYRTEAGLKEEYDTKVHSTRQGVIDEIRSGYPNARLLKELS